MCEEDLKEISEAMEVNETILHVQANQYGLGNMDSKKALQKIENCCQRNRTNSKQSDFNVRFAIHTKDIEFIDSIYRNKM